VTKAFKEMDEVTHPLLGMPFIFGSGTSHNPNIASQMVQATESGWVTVSDWVVGK
jgi:hypothetical protein